MSIFGLPDLMHQVGVVDMGDLEFIQTKVLAGDYFQVSGNINTLNDTIEFIVPSVKTAFLIEAKIVITTHVTPASRTASSGTTTTKDQVAADLKIDSVIKDKTNMGFSSVAANAIGSVFTSNNAIGDIGDGKFNVLGLSLVGNGIKKIEIVNTLDDGSAFATMSGYLV